MQRHPPLLVVWLVAGALGCGGSCRPASAPKGPQGAAPASSSGALRPLSCPDGRSCRDAQGLDYQCTSSGVRTGRSEGYARTCTPATCASAPCRPLPALSGEVIDGDSRDFPHVADADVVVSVAGIEEKTHTRTDAGGHYAFLVPPGVPLFVRVDREGWVTELHGVTVPATGWDVPLDLRHASTFDGMCGVCRPQDRARGMLVFEFLGVDEPAGIGATVTPGGDPPAVFDREWRPALSDRLLPGGRELQYFPNLAAGTVRLELLAPPGVRCAVQAAGIVDWPVGPGVLTQVDVECVKAP